MQGYDLDGTLAAVDFTEANTRGLTNVYRSAKLIYAPREPFIIITARRVPTTAERNATIEWCQTNVPNYRGLYFVDGTEDEVIAKKVRYIRSRELTAWTDNNPGILAKMKELTDVPLYLMTADGTKERYR